MLGTFRITNVTVSVQGSAVVIVAAVSSTGEPMARTYLVDFGGALGIGSSQVRLRLETNSSRYVILS
mgnify:CR=1 FL=1